MPRAEGRGVIKKTPPCLSVEGGAVIGSNMPFRSPPSRGLKGLSLPFLGVLTAGTHEYRHPYP
jgi:hypothetical protein